MKKAILILTALAAFAYTSLAKPQSVIFDTDMGNDADDALALLVLYKLQDEGLLKLECIAINKDNPQSAIATDIIAQYYGRGEIPLCTIARDTGVSKSNGWFLKEVVEKKNDSQRYAYARSIDADMQLPEAVSHLRKTLANAEDKSIVYISVGFLSNIANLLKSAPDANSPLSGKELFAKKVKCVSVMGAAFSKQDLADPKKSRTEFNIMTDKPSSKYVFENCPVDIIFSGWEIGANIRYPREVVDALFTDGNNPILFIYDIASLSRYKDTLKHDWPTYDLTSVLYAVQPELFGISERGTVSFLDEKGRTTFAPSKDGKHRYLIADEQSVKDKIKYRLIELTNVARK